MRFIIMAGPGPNTTPPDPNAPFDEKLFATYMKFNEDLAKAGVLVASEGLSPAGAPAQVIVSNGQRIVTDGPYAEAKELVGGFYLIDVKSREEAIQWALRSPCGFGFDDVLEIRQLTGGDDLPPHLLELIAKVAPTWWASISK